MPYKCCKARLQRKRDVRYCFCFCILDFAHLKIRLAGNVEVGQRRLSFRAGLRIQQLLQYEVKYLLFRTGIRSWLLARLTALGLRWRHWYG